MSTRRLIMKPDRGFTVGRISLWAGTAVFALLVQAPPALANELLRIGSSAASAGLGGSSGMVRDGLTAMTANPAYLEASEPGLTLGASVLLVDSEFTSSLGESDKAERGPALVPEIAYVARPGDSGFTFGAAFTVRATMRAEFGFTDPPGTLGVSYGPRRHMSEYTVSELGLALAYPLTEQLSVGGKLGLSYNRNRLQAPYIFQSHPLLQGLKVLTDLDVDDTAASAMLGLDYRLNDSIRLNLSWSMESEFSATGELDGNLEALGLGIQPDFNYDARVSTGMPEFLSFGLSYQHSPGLQLGLQIDRIAWDRTFRDLPIQLSEGSNDDLNAFLGSYDIRDVAPLDWGRQYNYHLGIEQQLAGNMVLRLGYEYSDVPVPESTVTPLTGAILRHSLSAGLGLIWNDQRVDIAYRYGRSSGTRHIDNSALRGGEYNGSSLDLGLHSLTLTVRF